MHLSHYAPVLGAPCANYQDNLRRLYLINKPSNRIINHILWPANQNFVSLYKKDPSYFNRTPMSRCSLAQHGTLHHNWISAPARAPFLQIQKIKCVVEFDLVSNKPSGALFIVSCESESQIIVLNHLLLILWIEQRAISQP